MSIRAASPYPLDSQIRIEGVRVGGGMFLLLLGSKPRNGKIRQENSRTRQISDLMSVS